MLFPSLSLLALAASLFTPSTYAHTAHDHAAAEYSLERRAVTCPSGSGSIVSSFWPAWLSSTQGPGTTAGSFPWSKNTHAFYFGKSVPSSRGPRARSHRSPFSPAFPQSWSRLPLEYRFQEGRRMPTSRPLSSRPTPVSRCAFPRPRLIAESIHSSKLSHFPRSRLISFFYQRVARRSSLSEAGRARSTSPTT